MNRTDLATKSTSGAEPRLNGDFFCLDYQCRTSDFSDAFFALNASIRDVHRCIWLYQGDTGRFENDCFDAFGGGAFLHRLNGCLQIKGIDGNDL